MHGIYERAKRVLKQRVVVVRCGAVRCTLTRGFGEWMGGGLISGGMGR